MIRQMQYYIAVVETGSFSEAAEACHISQSAVSQQIRALEDDLGVELIARRGRKFEITPAGRYFYRQARRMTAEMESIVRETRSIGSGEHRLLRVGVLSGFSARVMRGAAAEFAAAHPNVQMLLVSGTHEEIFQKIVAGQLDLVVNDQRRALASHFVNEELGDQPLYALMRQELAPAGGAAELEALKDVLCAVVSPPALRENETTFWRDVVGVRSDILFVESVEAACMNAAAGTAWMPCDRDMPTDGGMALVPLTRDGVPLKRKMFAFWLGSNDSSLQWAFAETLRRHFT